MQELLIQLNEESKVITNINRCEKCGCFINKDKLHKCSNWNLFKQGKTYEEIYGVEKAKEIKDKISKNHRHWNSEEMARKVSENAKINPNFGRRGKHLSKEQIEKQRITYKKFVDRYLKEHGYHFNSRSYPEKEIIKDFLDNKLRIIDICHKFKISHSSFWRILNKNKINHRNNHVIIPNVESERKKKISSYLQGISLEEFNGFIYTKEYDEKFNEKFKRLIRKRDNQVCMLCGIHREKLNRALAIHHIDYDKFNSIPENCISLCCSCHSKTNKNRKYWIEFFRNLLIDKYHYDYSLDNQEVYIIK